MELQNNNIVNEFPNFEGIISSCKEMQSIFENFPGILRILEE